MTSPVSESGWTGHDVLNCCPAYRSQESNRYQHHCYRTVFTVTSESPRRASVRDEVSGNGYRLVHNMRLLVAFAAVVSQGNEAKGYTVASSTVTTAPTHRHG